MGCKTWTKRKGALTVSQRESSFIQLNRLQRQLISILFKNDLFVLIYMLMMVNKVITDDSPEKELRRFLRKKLKEERRRLKAERKSNEDFLKQILPQPFSQDFLGPQVNGCSEGNSCVRVRDCPFLSDSDTVSESDKSALIPQELCLMIRGVHFRMQD